MQIYVLHSICHCFIGTRTPKNTVIVLSMHDKCWKCACTFRFWNFGFLWNMECKAFVIRFHKTLREKKNCLYRSLVMLHYVKCAGHNFPASLEFQNGLSVNAKWGRMESFEVREQKAELERIFFLPARFVFVYRSSL